MPPRRLLAAALLMGLFTTTAQADEGMWMPGQLSDIAAPMRAAGFRGDVRTLADVTRPPLSAVVRAGGGTGAFVSGDGLLLARRAGQPFEVDAVIVLGVKAHLAVIAARDEMQRDVGQNQAGATRHDTLPAGCDFAV